MATKFDIVSQALVLLGEAPISSFSEGTAGLVANQFYDTTYEGLLTSHRWRFAIGKQSFGQLTAAPLNEWRYAYQIPSQVLMMIRIYPDARYEIYEDKIYTNANEVAADYVYKPDESKLPAYFVEAFAARLAETFAIPITNNQGMGETMAQRAAVRFSEAVHKDSQGRPPTPIRRRPFIDVRA